MARVTALLCLGFAASAVHAQVPRPLGMADAHLAEATFSDVYVNDSFAASEAIARAEDLAQRGDWDHAAELLQRTADEGGDKLIRIAPGYYIGIREHINRLIAAWPGSGIAAYRFLFEQRLQAELDGLGPRPPRQALRALLERYFCTNGAADLAESLAQAAVEAGDFAAAESVCRRMIAHHPSGQDVKARFEALLAVITAMSDAIGGEDAGDTLTIRWMGEERRVADLRKEIRERFTISSAPASPDSWAMFNGNPERNRRASTHVDELGLLWRTRIDPSPGHRTQNGREGADAERSLERAEGLAGQVVADGGLLFVQRYREIVAVRAHTGAIAWRFRADSSRTGELPFADDQPSGWDAVTVVDGRVYGSLSGETLPFYSYESARSPSELVCLDAATGQTIWRLDQQVIEEDFAEVMFDSSPLVRGGRMFVVGRRRRSFGFEDCYLYCFDSRHGELRFRTHLGSASTGTFGARRATRAIAAMHGDAVFVCSNLGTMAAVSGTTGSVLWLRLYPRREASAEGAAGSMGGSRRPWRYNPVIWSEGRLIARPLDAAAVLVFDAADGALRHEIPIESIGKFETLFGVGEDLVCGAGEQVGCFDLRVGGMKWAKPLPDGQTPLGRGQWADDRLLVPSRRGLHAFSVMDGEHELMRWDTEGRAGNVLALEDAILLADGQQLSAYVRLTDILSALRERMRVAAHDPAVALELAEVSLSNGEPPEAMSVLAEAVRRAERAGERLDPLVRRRLFDDAILFAQRLAARGRLSAEALQKLFNYAAAFTPSAAANVSYRFRFAELFEQHGAPEQAVMLYQQILRDRLLRELSAESSGPPAQTAGATARYRIGALIEQHGRSVYAPHESEAATLLERAVRAADGLALDRVVETFPNSQAAGRALIARGDLLITHGQGEAAAQKFARAMHDYAKQVDRPLLYRKIADAYESADRKQQAYRWLAKAAREHPGVRFEHEGRMVTFAEYRARLDRVRKSVEPSRPALRLPLDHRFEIALVGDVHLLGPRFADVPHARWRSVFIRTGEAVMAYDSRNGRALWPAEAKLSGAVELLFSGEDVALFATPHEIVGLDARTGSRRWTYGSSPPGARDPNADWEQDDAFRGFALTGDRLVAVREGGRMVCLSIGSGAVIWTGLQPAPCRRIWYVTDAQAVCHAMSDDHAVIQILRADTGTPVAAIATPDERSFEAMFPTIDGHVVVVGSEAITRYDVQMGTPRWHYPLRGRAFAASLLLDVDTLYFSDNGRTIKSLNLEGGTLQWESERLATRRHEDVAVSLAGSSVIVTSTSSVAAVDAVTGLTLWYGMTPEEPRFLARWMTESYLAAVDVPEELQRDATAYFYDHRNGSGLISRDGGAASLGRLPDLKTVLATDAGLIVQTGSTVRGWVHR